MVQVEEGRFRAVDFDNFDEFSKPANLQIFGKPVLGFKTRD